MRTVAAALSVLLLAGCSSSSGGGVTDSTVPAPASSPKAAAAKPKAVARVGSSIRLDEETVTLAAVKPTARSSSSMDEAGSGKRYFAAQFVVTNSGGGQIDDNANLSATVLDGQGQSYDATILGAELKAGPSLPSAIHPGPGARVRGWVAFEVPVKARIVAVEWTAGGFGTTGHWKVA